jgi:hypothetical protein
MRSFVKQKEGKKEAKKEECGGRLTVGSDAVRVGEEGYDSISGIE